MQARLFLKAEPMGVGLIPRLNPLRLGSLTRLTLLGLNLGTLLETMSF
jgi:hypothetical protein